MKKALYYKKDGKTVDCKLCPHKCSIKPNKYGKCKVRVNIDGELYSENYNKISALNPDPIEKKPLYHFYPGTNILSIGSVGCNLKCNFCQNSSIAQTSIKQYGPLKEYNSDDIIKSALEIDNNIGIAYTYNEPIIYFETVMELAKKAKDENLKNVIVTNGFINKKPLLDLLQYIDAFNVDLKAFNNSFYKKFTSSKLSPVLKTLKRINKAGKHLEITNLIIPTLNDNIKEFKKMVTWIANELGKNTVLHLSRYFPHHKMKIDSTPIDTLTELYEIAKKKLPYTYLGNVNTTEGRDTYCSRCNKLVIKRTGYTTETIGIDKTGKCVYCNNDIAVI